MSRHSVDVCEVPGCGRDRFARRLCAGHYNRLLRGGSVVPHVPLGAWYEEPPRPCACPVPVPLGPASVSPLAALLGAAECAVCRRGILARSPS